VKRLALVLLAATPALATIWTRSTHLVKIPRHEKEPLAHAAYTTRGWSVSVTSASVVEEARGPESVGLRWLFDYSNTDAEPHYVAVTVQYQDAQRRERGRVSSKATLPPTRKGDGRFEVATKRPDEWREVVFARITIDFLSGPDG
jgi:hypothetical protein